MSKTFEALEKAEKEFQKSNTKPVDDVQGTYMPALPKKSRARVASCKVVDLKTRLMTRYAKESIKTILITGTDHGIGASTTAVSLATALTKDSSLKVLLVDANLRTPGLHDLFKIEYADGVYDMLIKKDKKSLRPVKTGPGNMFVLPSGVNGGVEGGYFESERFDALLKTTRKTFDYVIVDCAPIGLFPDSQALCARVDGVILVIEAGKTRRQVALRSKKELEDAGGRVLGVILNRRKHYIPEWIYKRL